MNQIGAVDTSSWLTDAIGMIVTAGTVHDGFNTGGTSQPQVQAQTGIQTTAIIGLGVAAIAITALGIYLYNKK